MPMLILPPSSIQPYTVCAGTAGQDAYFIGAGILAGIIAIILLFLKSKMSKSIFYTLFILTVLFCVAYSFDFGPNDCGKRVEIFRFLPMEWVSPWFTF
jgi:hypothetical protein